jgi:alkylation response protein AidB-like acyl-CoA dehydrogenase
VDFRYPPEVEAFRQEVLDFLKVALTPEYHEERRSRTEHDGDGPATIEFVAKLKERGYLTHHWPKEYGGQSRSFLDRVVLHEEFARAGATINTLGGVGINIVAPALMHFGTERQKTEILPRIARGEWIFCQMFTEPGAGSDLANLSTTAVRDGDDYVVNGTKVFTTRAHLSSHGYLLARTDPTATRHRGISLFVIEMNSPGIDVRPLVLAEGSRHNFVFMENVRVPASHMVGEEHRGWYHAMVSFDFERAAGSQTMTIGREREVNRLLDYAKATVRRDKPLGQNPEIRKQLVQAYRDVRVGRALGRRIIDLHANGRIANSEASELSMFEKAAQGRLSETAALVYGSYGQLHQDTPNGVDGGSSSWWRLAGRHGAGTIEIQRNVIAQRGLGLPR